jgi:SsrA-binding protein
MVKESGRKLIAQNKKGRHDYFIDEVFEAGLVLQGTEVKSLRAGRATLTDGYAAVKEGELWLAGVHIPEYNEGSWTNHEPRRERKLLLQKREIAKLIGKLKESGLTLIPLSLYFKDGIVKVEMGVARGKKAHDKRESLKEQQASREIDRALSQRASGKSSLRSRGKDSRSRDFED